MTREEAIKRLDGLSAMDGYITLANREDYEAIREARNLLQNEPCEDAVSRKAVDLLCFEFLRANSDDNCAFYERFRDLPAVTPTHKASELQQDHAILKAHSDGANEVIDRIKEAREEMQKLRGCSCSCSDGIIDDVEDIMDKLIAEVEETK